MATIESLTVTLDANPQALLSEWERAKVRQKLKKDRFNNGRGVNLLAFRCEQLMELPPGTDVEGVQCVLEAGPERQNVGILFHAFRERRVAVVLVRSAILELLKGKWVPDGGGQPGGTAGTVNRGVTPPPPPPVTGEKTEEDERGKI